VQKKKDKGVLNLETAKQASVRNRSQQPSKMFPPMRSYSLNVFLAVLSLLSILSTTTFAKIKGKNEFESLGVVLLDAITFPKVVPHPKLNVLVMVCNKGEIGNYMSDSLRADFLNFAQKGELQGNTETVIFAQVIVNGAQNAKLAERIGVKGELVTPKSFLYKPGDSRSIPYTGAYNMVALTRWLSKHTDFFYGTPGTIESFDKLAERFVFADPSEYDAIIAEAEAMRPSVELKDKKNAVFYINYMEKIKEKGIPFILAEIERVENILESEKLSDGKKLEMQKKINIIHQFDFSSVRRHDEL